jgi:tripartite ATP-independent transporter DctP family solute receptor
MKFARRLLVGCMVAVMLVTFVACGGGEKKVVLKCGGIQSADDLSTQAMEKMGEIVKEKTGGTVEIQVFPAGQLGNATSQVEAVSIGSQDMFVDAGSFMATFAPDKLAESMFFMFESEDHYRKFLESDLNRELEKQFEDKQGVKVIANNWLRVPRSISSKKPINSVDDMVGLKMRVPDIKAYLESAQALGAKPTQIAWGETYLALQQGVVDACESPMDSMYTMKFYEPTKTIIVTEHLRDNMVVMINASKLDSLSDKQQEALIAASKEAGEWYSAQVKEKENEFVELMKSEGTEFIEVDIEPMKQKVAEAAKKLEQEGLWSAGLYEKIQSLK